MDLNATLIGRLFIFAIFYRIVQTKIWPSFYKILQDRQAHIAAGLESAEKGRLALETARKDVELIISEGRAKVKNMIDQAHHQAEDIKSSALVEAKKILAHAHDQAMIDAKKLQAEFMSTANQHYADILALGFSKVLGDQNTHSEFVEKIVQQALNDIDQQGLK